MTITATLIFLGLLWTTVLLLYWSGRLIQWLWWRPRRRLNPLLSQPYKNKYPLKMHKRYRRW